MIIVLDTNVLLISLRSSSPYRPIFDALLQGKYQLGITEDILQEYTEIIGEKTQAQIAENLGNLLLRLENVKRIHVSYRWGLIHNDPDDNKFVDCALACGAKYIVTNDRHFNILKEIEFPPVDIISATDFLEEIKEA